MYTNSSNRKSIDMVVFNRKSTDMVVFINFHSSSYVANAGGKSTDFASYVFYGGINGESSILFWREG